MDGVRRERRSELSSLSADLPNWLPRRRTNQTHRLTLGEQQDMTFFFFLLNPKYFSLRLTQALSFCSFSLFRPAMVCDPAVVLFREPRSSLGQAFLFFSPRTFKYLPNRPTNQQF